MSRKANPTVIGGFVVGAVVLAVAGITYFGGESFISEKLRFVAFFDGSLKGLQVGAPVTFRGVRIGEVSDIVVRYDSQDQSVRIPVYFETARARVESVRGRSADPYMVVRSLINDGLRAQLAIQSFVTGQIAIQLNYNPDKPADYVGADPNTFEFPTIPSTTEKMGKALEDFDLHALLENLESTVKGINELANSQKLRDAVASLDTTIKEIGDLARNVNEKVDPITKQIEDTGASARRAIDQFHDSVDSVSETVNPAIKDAQKLIQDLEKGEHPFVRSFVETAKAGQEALQQAREAFAVAKRDLSEDSELYRSLVLTLDELASAARSIRMLADYLEQHPEALLQGKSAEGTR